MTIQEFAKMLDGREMGNEMTWEQKEQAKKLGFVVIFGYSDDNAIIRGVITDEVSCIDGEEIYLDERGMFEKCNYKCSHSELAKEKCKRIEIVWHNEGEYCWTYDTDIPHAIFNIMEDGTGYCKGIVFDIKNLGEEVETRLYIDIPCDYEFCTNTAITTNEQAEDCRKVKGIDIVKSCEYKVPF